MFVIAVYKNIEEYRNSRLDQLLEGNTKTLKKYLSKNGRRFGETIHLLYCEYWKTSSAPTKIINEWNKLENKRDWKGKFSSVWGDYLVVEKLSKEEWNSLMDQKIQSFKNRLNKQIQDIEKERNEYI